MSSRTSAEVQQELERMEMLRYTIRLDRCLNISEKLIREAQEALEYPPSGLVGLNDFEIYLEVAQFVIEDTELEEGPILS